MKDFKNLLLTISIVTQLLGCNKNLTGGYSQVANSAATPLPAATLDLDFANDRYVFNHASFTGLANFIAAAAGSFSRNSTATYFDSTGALQTAAVNAPRLDHDPNTGTAKGLLIEESSANNLLYSTDMTNAVWSASTSVTPTANAALAPDGTMTAMELSANGTSLSYFQQLAGTVASLTVTRSFFVKPGTTSVVAMEFGDTTNCNPYCVATFDLSAQTATWGAAKPGEGSLVIQKMNNGWFRVSGTYAHSSTGSNHDVLYVGAYGSGLGNLYVWGPQLEFKAFATSYIPTSASVVTRSADNFSFPVGSWFNTSSGTFFSTSYGQFNSNQINYGRVIGGDGTRCYNGFSSTLTSMNSSTNLSALAVTGTVTASPSTPVNMAMAWDQSSSTVSAAISSGNLASGSYSGDWSTTNLYPGGSNLNPINASVSRVTYYSTRLSNTALTAWAH